MSTGIKISNLSFTSSVSGTGLIPIVQDNTTCVANLSTIVNSGVGFTGNIAGCTNICVVNGIVISAS